MTADDFIIPADKTYMCGHSLGPLHKSSQINVQQVIKSWEESAVQAWNSDSWIDLPTKVARQIAPLLGAHAENVVMSDSTSVNLFKVLLAALKVNSQRKIILTTDDNFPADYYVAEGVRELKQDLQLKIVARESLLENLDEDVAVLMLTQVNYRDARAYSLEKISEHAHNLGILTVWDLSHSVGAIPINLTDANVDFAIGCTYKYLSGGPGSPAFIYVHEKHQEQLISPIYGWMGHDKPFAFENNFRARGARQFIGGTPYILSLKALEGSLDCFADIDMQDLNKQSLINSTYLIKALQDLQLQVITPLLKERGGHVAFIHPKGYALSRALIEHGIINDYREPGLIRLCVNPLYLSLEDIQKCVEKITYLLDRNIYLNSKYNELLKVT
ncbi:MAG: kynureninase [Legionellaceae bacterium]|nr:kynureninase [Legionellaceae bacterium]